MVASGGGSRALLKQTRSRVGRVHPTSFEAARWSVNGLKWGATLQAELGWMSLLKNDALI